MNDRGISKLSRVFAALANPHRLRIYEALFSQSMSTCCDRILACEPAVAQTDLVKMLGLAQSTISHHLTKLEEAGLVLTEKRGSWTCYFADPGMAAEIGSFFTSLPRGGSRDDGGGPEAGSPQGKGVQGGPA